MQAGLIFCSQHPVRARIAYRIQVADRHVQPQPVVTPPRFQKKHAALGVARQPVRKNAARRAGADDDVVVLSVQSPHGAVRSGWPDCRWVHGPTSTIRRLLPDRSRLRLAAARPAGTAHIRLGPGEHGFHPGDLAIDELEHFGVQDFVRVPHSFGKRH